jgi:hypothetical protein
MQTLLANKDAIFELKKKVEGKDISLYDHIAIPNIPITEETISIVMTACNRSKQTYFTLKTIQNSSHKAIQVIIVDDSDKDRITKEELEKFPFYIDFISINTQNKNWVNPVVNYNIGFEYIQGSKVVIQNAEVCHVGDVLTYMGTQLVPNNYYICDVRACRSFASNNFIYQFNTNTIDIYNFRYIYCKWYQGKSRMSNLHFLVGMTLDTFDKLKKFSYDYSFGVDADDIDFVIKIKSKNINIVNLFHDEYYFGGIHLFHTSSYLKWENIESNNNMYFKKLDYYMKKGIYVDITENIESFDEKYNIILYNNADTTR